MLITDHNVRETLRITDRAYIVHGGVIFKSGTPDKPRGRRRGPADLLWGREFRWTRIGVGIASAEAHAGKASGWRIAVDPSTCNETAT